MRIAMQTSGARRAGVRAPYKPAVISASQHLDPFIYGESADDFIEADDEIENYDEEAWFDSQGDYSGVE